MLLLQYVIPAPLINVAATCVGTRALGPGRRSVVWVQGCPFRCADCLSPEWIPQREARLASPAELVEELLADRAITGLTFSGGEPMTQAAGLAEVARLARQLRDLTLICFTGYRLATLRSRPPAPGVAGLLSEVDVLIDGLYVRARNDGRGLRGSDNQQVHHLTGRLRSDDAAMSTGPRRSEIRLRNGTALLVGVPVPAVAEVFDRIPGAPSEL